MDAPGIPGLRSARNQQNRGLNRRRARLDIPRTGQNPIQTIAAPIVCIGHDTRLSSVAGTSFDRAGNTDIAAPSAGIWIPVSRLETPPQTERELLSVLFANSRRNLMKFRVVESEFLGSIC